MNSIWLILLLLCCCNNDGRGNCAGNGSCTNSCIEPRNADCGCGRNDTRDSDCGCGRTNVRDADCGCGRVESRNTDCGCERNDNDRDCDYDVRMSPFSPLNRRERMDADYETFRGHHGPCGCEENAD